MSKRNAIDDPESRLLIRKFRRGDEDSGMRLIDSLERMITKIALKYNHEHTELDDLIQVGRLGAFKALGTFDLERKTKFTTYATWWIKNFIMTEADKTRHSMSVRYRDREKISQVKKAEDDLRTELQREPTSEEISERSKVDDSGAALNLLAGVISLDLGDEVTAGDLLKSDDDTLSSVLRKESSSRIIQAIKKLDDRTAHVIRSYFGLYDGHCYTLNEIGNGIGLSGEGVRLIKDAGVDLLSHMPEVKGLLRLI